MLVLLNYLHCQSNFLEELGGFLKQRREKKMQEKKKKFLKALPEKTKTKTKRKTTVISDFSHAFYREQEGLLILLIFKISL